MAASAARQRDERERSEFDFMIDVLILTSDIEERDALDQAVASEGARPLAVGSLASAAGALERGDFPLVFAAHRLPEASGAEIASAIRAAAGVRPCRLVALPGRGLVSKRELAAAGFDDVLHLPLDLADIALRIQSAARLQPPETDSESAGIDPDASIIRRLALDLAWSTAIDQQARHGLEAAMRALGARRGAVWIRDPEDRMIRCAAQSGLSDGYAVRGGAMFNYLRHDAWVELSRRARFDGAPQRSSGSTGDLARAEGISSILTAALFTPSRVLGALTLFDIEAADVEPDEESLGIVEAIAAITAMALDQTQLRDALGASEATYRQLVDEMPLGVFVHDAQGNFLMSNAAIASVCGYDEDELALMSVFDLLDGGQSGTSGRLLGDVLAEISADAAAESEFIEMVGPLELTFVAADGRRIEAETYFRPLRLAGRDDGLWIQGMARDVTNEARARRELEALRTVAGTLVDVDDVHQALRTVLIDLHAAIPFLHASVWLLSADLRELVCRAQTGYEYADLLCDADDAPLRQVIVSRRSLRLIDVQDDEDTRPAHRLVQQIAVVPVLADERLLGVLQVQTGDDRTLEERDVQFLESVAAQIAGRVERLDLQRAIERLETTDPVTGLDSRATFHRKIGVLVDPSAAPRSERQQVSLLIVGVDGFRKIERMHGPTAAGELLRQIGSTVVGQLEPPYAAARYSADEFAVTLPGVGREKVVEIAESVRIGIATQLFTVGEQLEQITVSIGTASAPDDATSAERLIAVAAHACRLAKQSGQNQVYQSDSALAELAVHHERFEELPDQIPTETLALLVEAMDQRRPERKGHAERITRYVLAIGHELRMDDAALAHLRVATLIHDIGRFLVPGALRCNAPGTSDSDLDTRSAVPAAAHRLLSRISLPPEISLAVVHQHEHWDGAGYPARLSGETIPLGARIIAVADALDTLSSRHPGREPAAMDEALDHLMDAAGARFDPLIVDTARHCFGDVAEPFPDSTVGTIDEALLLIGS